MLLYMLYLHYLKYGCAFLCILKLFINLKFCRLSLELFPSNVFRQHQQSFSIDPILFNDVRDSFNNSRWQEKLLNFIHIAWADIYFCHLFTELIFTPAIKILLGLGVFGFFLWNLGGGAKHWVKRCQGCFMDCY